MATILLVVAVVFRLQVTSRIAINILKILGNGILPESIPCKNVDNDAKGEKNIVNIEGIVFP